MPPADFAEFMKTQKCHEYEQLGHWKTSPEHKENRAESKGSSKASSSNKHETKKKTLTFNHSRIQVCTTHQISTVIDPPADDGAMYSGIVESQLSAFLRVSHWKNQIEGLPPSLSNGSKWAYGPPEHSSESRPIIDSIVLSLESPEGDLIIIRLLVIKGDSQWIVGGNIVSFWDNIHLKNVLLFQNGISIPTHTENNLCYVSATRFRIGNPSYLVANSSRLSGKDLQSQLKNVDKVHEYVCGHPKFERYEHSFKKECRMVTRYRKVLERKS